MRDPARFAGITKRPFRESGFSDEELEAIVELMGAISERRFRMEGLISLHVAMHTGTDGQPTRATEVLDEYARSDDEMLAGMARHFRNTELDEDQLKSLLEVLGM